MKTYIAAIARNRNLPLETARLTYAIMLGEHGTLDALSPMDFDREADLAAAEVAMDRVMASKIAESYGIPSLASLGLV
jgi:hypothetical protein